MADTAVHIDSAGTHEIIPSGSKGRIAIERVVVNTGDPGATVTLRYADNEAGIAVIAADNPSVGQTYGLLVDGRGLEAVVTGSPDVTITTSRR